MSGKLPFSQRPYRRGVGILLLNDGGEVLVARRIDARRGGWQMPQGGIDPGEAPRQTALRELEEEIGTAKAEIIGESRDWFHYDLPRDLADRVWRGRYRGQRQKWFAMKFLGRDSDIRLDAHVPEFDAWKWIAAADLCEMIVPFKRALYQSVLDEFRHLVPAPTP